MKAFALKLTNQAKSGWLAAGFTVLSTTTAIGSMVWLHNSIVVSCAVLLGLLGGFMFLLKKVAIEPSLVTIEADRITVLNTSLGEARRVLFDEIASYQYWDYSGGRSLRIKRKDATTFHLSDKSEEFAAMVLEFESALARHQRTAVLPRFSEKTNDAVAINQPADEKTPLSLRKKTFFEKQISTIGLVAMTVMVAYLGWSIATTDRPVPGTLYAGLGGYVTYVGAWYAARERRRS